jgi:hypothetical protein
MPTLTQISPADGPTGSYTYTDDNGNVRGCPARGDATEENFPADVAAWLAGEYQPVNPVPTSVLPGQIRKALTAAGLRTAVEAAVAAAPQDVRDDWEYSLAVHRANPLLNQMATQLGMTSEQVDDLFRAAATL